MYCVLPRTSTNAMRRALYIARVRKRQPPRCRVSCSTLPPRTPLQRRRGAICHPVFQLQPALYFLRLSVNLRDKVIQSGIKRLFNIVVFV